MRKSFAAITLISLLSLFIIIPTALAVNAPTLDPIISPVDATKAIITGKTEPGNKIIITGGQYDLPPVTADSKGKFSVTVGLVQETTNNFSIVAQDSDGNNSDPIQITIIESAEQAAAAEASGEGDHSAPEAPTIDEYPQTVDTAKYTFTGTAEAGATIKVTGDATKSAKSNSEGAYVITLTLKQNQENKFTFSVMDSSGNISPATKATITHKSNEPEVVETEEGTLLEIQSEETDEQGESKPVTIRVKDIFGHWAQDYIVDMIEAGVVRGYNDDTFRPDNPINRAEFIKMVLKAFEYDITDIDEGSLGQTFTDVPSTEWYASYVQKAFEEGIVGGYSDSTFRPENTLNRAEAMKILLKGAGVFVENGLANPFSDISENDWFASYVLTASNLRIVSGYSDGRFGPNDAMTRGQVAKVIMELLEK